MSSEHFIKYLKNPKLLNEVTYDELSQMRDKYPYSHILHYLLFLKSQQSPADLAEHQKNASIFAVDNNKLFEEIKEFQELEQKPTTIDTMDDLFDLSDDEADKKSTTSREEVTPTTDSENTVPTPPPAVQDTQPRIIREQRYIPLDPKIYETSNNEITRRIVREQPVEKPVENPIIPPTTEDAKTAASNTSNNISKTTTNTPKPVDKAADSKQGPNEKANVFFIDALINLDSNDDRIELVTNEDAYKELTDTPIVEPVRDTPIIESKEQEVSPYIEEETVSETIDPFKRKIDVPLEITNEEPQALPEVEAFLEPMKPVESIDAVERIEKVESVERSESVEPIKHEESPNTSEDIDVISFEKKEDLETKKSFDKWVRKNKADKKKSSAKKKKKKKKGKMPTNAKVSLQETDIMASETLAELLVKQGRNKKAIKVYERLCLIFPQKSNYFAQIIKNLKNKS